MFNQFAQDFYEIFLRLVGWFYRSPRMKALLKSVSKGLNEVNALFVAFRLAIIYKLKWNAQIIVLERFLNEQYSLAYDHNTRLTDITAGTIIHIEDLANIPFTYIRNASEIPPALNTYFYNKSETPPKPKKYLYSIAQLISVHTHYIVKVPASLTFSLTVLKSQINTYNLAGKVYIVQTY